jgi:hypothetical protein
MSVWPSTRHVISREASEVLSAIVVLITSKLTSWSRCCGWLSVMADCIMLSVTSHLLSRHDRWHLIILCLRRRSLVIVILSPCGVHAITTIVDRATLVYGWLRGHQVRRVVVLSNQITVWRGILLILLKLSIEASLTSALMLINCRRWSVLRLRHEFIHAVLTALTLDPTGLLIYVRCASALGHVRVRVVTRLIANRRATWPKGPGVTVVGIVVVTSITQHTLVMGIHRRHLSMLLRSSIWTLSVYKVVCCVL